MQVVSDVSAQKTEERGNRKRLVAVSNNLEVNAVLVVQVREERDCGVDGDHKQYSYYMSLLIGSKVMRRVHKDEKEGDHNGDETKDGRQPESQPMKCVVMPDWDFSDGLVLECGVALGPAHLVKHDEEVVGLLGAQSHRSGGV